MITNLANLPAGRPSVPRDALETVLSRYVQYDAEQRAKRTAHRPLTPFLDLMNHSKQWYYNYLRNQHITRETLLATVSDELCLVVTFGQPPSDITWANPAFHRALGYSFEEAWEQKEGGKKLFAGYTSALICSESATHILHNGKRLSDVVAAEHERVRLSGGEYVGHADKIHFNHADGHKVAFEMVEMRWTGIWLDRWIGVFRQLDEPDERKNGIARTE